MAALKLLNIKHIDHKTKLLGYGYIRKLEQLSQLNKNNTTPELIIFCCLLFYHEPLIIGKYEETVTMSEDFKTVTTSMCCGWANCYSNFWFNPKQTDKKTTIKVKIAQKNPSYNIFIGLSSNDNTSRPHCYVFSKGLNDTYAVSSDGSRYINGLYRHSGEGFKVNDEIEIIMFCDNLIYKIKEKEIERFTNFKFDKYKLAISMYDGPHSVSLLQLSTENIS